MAVTAKLYGRALLAALNGEIDAGAHTLKVMLCASTYTPDQDTHDYKDDVTDEVTGTGYTAGGATLANVALSYDAATNTVKLDADDVTWANSTITARFAVIYDDTPATAATKPLIAWVDFGEDVASSAGAFTITWDAAGIVTVSAA